MLGNWSFCSYGDLFIKVFVSKGERFKLRRCDSLCNNILKLHRVAQSFSQRSTEMY
jgi:hypothetical protein